MMLARSTDRKYGRRPTIQPSPSPSPSLRDKDKENEDPSFRGVGGGEFDEDVEEEQKLVLPQSSSRISRDIQEPFMGVKVRRRTSMYRQYRGDYLNAASNQIILKLLEKQGDRHVLFADSVVKLSKSGKIKRQALMITDVAAYILDAQWGNLKRRIALQAIEKVCLSELSDNFFAIIVPSEYDNLLASTRKTEIVTVLVEATKKITGNPLEVVFSNRFEYYVGSDSIREVSFEQVEGGVKTKFVHK